MAGFKPGLPASVVRGRISVGRELVHTSAREMTEITRKDYTGRNGQIFLRLWYFYWNSCRIARSFYGRTACCHCVTTPSRPIHSSSAARSIWSPETLHIARMSRKCFSEPPSRKYSNLRTITYSGGATITDSPRYLNSSESSGSGIGEGPGDFARDLLLAPIGVL